MNHPSCCFLHQEEFTFGKPPRKLTIQNVWFQQWNTGELLWWFGQQYHSTVFCWSHYYTHGHITVSEYVDRLGNHVHPMIQTSFQNNDAVFHEDNAPIHRDWTVQPWFEELEGDFQHLPWPAQSPNLNIIEPLRSVVETSMRNRFPIPTSLKQHQNVLLE
jgi:hypothetical protein